jgi:hypothetical protein
MRVKYIRKSVQQDLGILFRAQRVMTAVRSFIEAMLFLSAGPRPLYSVNSTEEPDLPYVACWKTREYAKAKKPWNRSKT